MCRTGCPTREHASWGECLRAARIQVGADPMGVPGRRAWDRELRDYANAVGQGIQPRGTTQPLIDAAVRHADTYGVAA